MKKGELDKILTSSSSIIEFDLDEKQKKAAKKLKQCFENGEKERKITYTFTDILLNGKVAVIMKVNSGNVEFFCKGKRLSKTWLIVRSNKTAGKSECHEIEKNTYDKIINK